MTQESRGFKKTVTDSQLPELVPLPRSGGSVGHVCHGQLRVSCGASHACVISTSI
jgi:hypothetical protein